MLYLEGLAASSKESISLISYKEEADSVSNLSRIKIVFVQQPNCFPSELKHLYKNNPASTTISKAESLQPIQKLKCVRTWFSSCHRVLSVCFS